MDAQCGFAGNAGGPEQRIPAAGFKPFQRFADRLHMGQRIGTFGAAHADRAQPAALDERFRRKQRIDLELDVSGNEIGQRLTGTLVRNIHGINLRHRLQHLHGEIGGIAGGSAGSQLTRSRPGQCDEFLDVVDRQ